MLMKWGNGIVFVRSAMRKNKYDVPVDWGKLSSHKPSKHAKSEKQIYWAKIRMAMKKKKFKGV